MRSGDEDDRFTMRDSVGGSRMDFAEEEINDYIEDPEDDVVD